MTERMAFNELPIICAGRAVDDALRPISEPCRRVYTGSEQQARAGGWSVGPDGAITCPSCRRPPKAVRDLIRERTLT
jgi:hypothetical protein